MLAACPTHCQACSSTGEEIKCNVERCDLGYGRSVEGLCEGDWLHSITVIFVYYIQRWLFAMTKTTLPGQ